MENPSRTLLVLSQVYVPDHAAVGQYMADASAEMVRRGWRVVVLTANRGYDDSAVKYPSSEVIDGVEIHRLPLSSFGKKSIVLRLVGGILFILQVVMRGIFTRRLSCVLVSTSPPICPVAAIVIAMIRRVPIKYWVMDLNPDQMVALGRIKPASLPARIFNLLNRIILARAADVIALDRFMAKRLMNKKAGIKRKLTVLPPWPMDEHLDPIQHENNPFRIEHSIVDKLVIMYSGNLSIASPVNTVLEAALHLRDEPKLIFVFIGGGVGKKSVDETIRQHQSSNILSLPYQPLSRIKYSLSAADVHLVAMGDSIVGICHPCKVYGAMAVARPILLLGPDRNHVADILQDNQIGWHIHHGAVDQAVTVIRQIVDTDREKLVRMGAKARQVIDREFSTKLLRGRFCDILEHDGMSDRSKR